MLTTIAAAVAMITLGCDKEEPKPSAPPVKSAAPTPAAPVSTPSAVPTPPPPTETESGPKVDCPKGSSGEGNFNKPCEATGTARMMEVTWTGKMDDKGPSFRVVNKSQATILFGKIAVYFYDKAGKQLEVPDTKAGASSEGDAKSPKTKPFHTCSGNMFGGVMKGGEKAVITFSCVKKAHVPEGAAAIEAEMQMVGFTDETEKKISSYWRNNDLAPEQRKKGGIKK